MNPPPASVSSGGSSLIEELLDAVRSGRALDPVAVARLLGAPPRAFELAAVRTLLEGLNAMPLGQAAADIARYLGQLARQQQLPLDRERHIVESAFDACARRVALSIEQRVAFGVLSSRHEAVLTEAIRSGRVSREQALAVVHDGRGLTELLAEQARDEIPLVFRTVDANGMPREPRDFDEFVIQERVRVTTKRSAFDLLVSNECELAQAAGNEHATIAWLEHTIEPHDVLWDVGANIGHYSILAASLHPTVRAIAFEPCATNSSRLNANIRANGMGGRVLAFPIALADTTGLGTFASTYQVAGGWSHRGLSTIPAPERGEFMSGCALFTLDEFSRQATFVPAPTHLKIDVDGPELAVLEGARQTLDNPMLRYVLVELRDEDVDTATTSMAGHGFLLVGRPWQGFGNRIFERRSSARAQTEG